MHVIIEDTGVKTMRDQFLKNIGGKVHVQCAYNRLPLTPSMDRKKNVDVAINTIIDAVSSIVMFFYEKYYLKIKVATQQTTYHLLWLIKMMVEKIQIAMSNLPMMTTTTQTNNPITILIRNKILRMLIILIIY